MPFYIVHGDITKMKTDAIVNAANTHLTMGNGVCGAIFSAAGAKALQKECKSKAPCATGNAVITKGYALAKYIIHTVGPVYIDGKHNESELLKAAYKNSLELAKKYKCNSVSFPLISAGIFGYPKIEALKLAKDTINEFINKNNMDVYLVLFDKGL